MGKNFLERCAERLPADILRSIVDYVPPPRIPWRPRLSPNAQRDLFRIQTSLVRGRNAMYMRDLEDFLLD
jgi:hypothetical protein